MPNQIKIRNGKKDFKIELDDFRNNGKKKNLKRHFWERSEKLLNRI